MSIKISAYDTSVCSGFITPELNTSIEKSYVDNSLRKVVYEGDKTGITFNYYLLEGESSSNKLIEPFYHPLFLKVSHKNQNGDKIEEVCLDVRHLGKYNTLNADFVIRNHSDYNFNITRLILNKIWITNNNLLKDFSNLPIQVYSDNIADNLSRRFALDPGERATIKTLAAYFYINSFTNTAAYDVQEYEKIMFNIIRSIRLPANMVYSIIDDLELEPIHSLDDLIKNIKDKVSNPSLKDLNLGTFFSIMSSIWYGINYKELSLVALEHPPTFLSMIYSSIMDNTYKKTLLNRIVTVYAKTGVSNEFTKNIEYYTSTKININKG